nr:atrophin-1-like [Mirounga angustirostris]
MLLSFFTFIYPNPTGLASRPEMSTGVGGDDTEVASLSLERPALSSSHSSADRRAALGHRSGVSASRASLYPRSRLSSSPVGSPRLPSSAAPAPAPASGRARAFLRLCARLCLPVRVRALAAAGPLFPPVFPPPPSPHPFSSSSRSPAAPHALCGTASPHSSQFGLRALPSPPLFFHFSPTSSPHSRFLEPPSHPSFLGLSPSLPFSFPPARSLALHTPVSLFLLFSVSRLPFSLAPLSFLLPAPLGLGLCIPAASKLSAPCFPCSPFLPLSPPAVSAFLPRLSQLLPGCSSSSAPSPSPPTVSFLCLPFSDSVPSSLSLLLLPPASLSPPRSPFLSPLRLLLSGYPPSPSSHSSSFPLSSFHVSPYTLFQSFLLAPLLLISIPSLSSSFPISLPLSFLSSLNLSPLLSLLQDFSPPLASFPLRLVSQSPCVREAPPLSASRILSRSSEILFFASPSFPLPP